MRKALCGFTGGFRIGGRTINNLRYADDIVLLTTSPGELQDLVNRVESVASEYNMQINAAKTKVMTNTEEALKIKVSSSELEQVDSFCVSGKQSKE
jgi:Reverse transcriptase (RNA-dependent DNA polymerase)